MTHGPLGDRAIKKAVETLLSEGPEATAPLNTLTRPQDELNVVQTFQLFPCVTPTSFIITIDHNWVQCKQTTEEYSALHWSIPTDISFHISADEWRILHGWDYGTGIMPDVISSALQSISLQ